VVAGVGIFGGEWWFNRDNTGKNGDSKTEKSYTKYDLTTYSSPQQCWMGLEDSVYDISSYLSSHSDKTDLQFLCGQVADNILNGTQQVSPNQLDLGFEQSVSAAKKEFGPYKVGKLIVQSAPEKPVTLEEIKKQVEEQNPNPPQ